MAAPLGQSVPAAAVGTREFRRSRVSPCNRESRRSAGHQCMPSDAAILFRACESETRCGSKREDNKKTRANVRVQREQGFRGSVSALDLGDKVPKPRRISDSRDDVHGAKEFAARVFRDQKVRCKCQSQEETNWHVVPDTNSTYGGTISILLTCETCGFESEKRVDFQHLEALGKAVFGTDRQTEKLRAQPDHAAPCVTNSSCAAPQDSRLFPSCHHVKFS